MKKRETMLKITLIIIFFFIGSVPVLNAAPKKIKVDVSLFEPCVIKTDKKLTGFDIEIWEAICKDLNWVSDYNIIPFSNIFADLKNKKTDVAIAGISITSEREKKIDFSHHYFNSGLRILVKGKSKKQNIIPVILKKLFNIEMLYLLSILFLILFIWGFLLWIAEKGADVISDKFKKGFSDATWCSWAVMTTIGFGDIYPKKTIGRLITVPIFLTGCVIVGVVSAPVITAFTMRDIDETSTQISSLDDLKGKIVGTEKLSTSASFLKTKSNIKLDLKKSINEAYSDLIADKVDAVVFDEPNIKFFAKKNKEFVKIVGEMFEKQYYGFALQANSPLRDEINKSLLKLRETGKYDEIYNKWFSNNENQ